MFENPPLNARIPPIIGELQAQIFFWSVFAIMLVVIVLVLVWKKVQADKINAELKRTEQLQRDLLANVSHDLRTPLTMIKGYAELVLDISGENREKREKNVNIIIREADRLGLLVDDVLTLSKMQAGTEIFNIEENNLSEIVKDICETFGNLEADVEPDLHAKIDKRRIEVVIYNLINNATFHGSVIKVKLLRIKDKIRFAVTDNGKGICDEDLPKIWERYHTKRNNGTGLGLAITKEILDKHGAQYGVDTILNEGTTFWFEVSAGKAN